MSYLDLAYMAKLTHQFKMIRKNNSVKIIFSVQLSCKICQFDLSATAS